MTVLDKMRDTMDLNKEQDEAEHQQFQTDCAKDIDFYQQEIAQAIVIIVDTQRKLDQATEDLKIIASLLEQLYGQLKLYTDALEKLNKIRTTEAQDFKDSMDEHDITTTAIEEAKRYFVQIRGDVSTFLQTKKNILAQVSTHFHNSKEQVKSRSYKALFQFLAQMSSKTSFDNAEVVAKILELCSRVLENIAASRQAEQEAESQRIGLYENKKSVLDENIGKTNSKIEALETQKHAIEEHMAIMKSIYDDQSARRDENTKLLKARQAECDNEVIEYGQLREKTLDQKNVCEKIITLVQTNLAVMKQYLKERREVSGVKIGQLPVF
eukprot:TRINITY_DN547_c0_g1_i2.p1 TRINITY_DN547_c0_g1~~TRINITY_DN547_c0_g1_i2.p1  ORF type:complete len:325 (-),score=40.45 TRINITY_DN547_c0_g1_i2:89-1063(-)